MLLLFYWTHFNIINQVDDLSPFFIRDGGVMFVTVDRSRKTRKQKRCDEDAERPNPLAVIAAAVRSDERITRSKSRRQQEERSRSRSGVKVSLSNAATDKCWFWHLMSINIKRYFESLSTRNSNLVYNIECKWHELCEKYFYGQY